MKKYQLLLLRDMYDNSSTTRPVVGKLFLQCLDAETNELIDESFVCDTLEPPARAAHPCIPGCETYEFKMVCSPKFGRVLPRLIKVPGRAGILIHSGNSKEDTRGCILVGKLNINHDYLTKSREALAKLISYIEYFNVSSIKVDINLPF